MPGSREGTIIFPGFDGGAEWGGAAFDPETHLLYVNANEMAWVLRLIEPALSTGNTSGKRIYLRECSSLSRSRPARNASGVSFLSGTRQPLF